AAACSATRTSLLHITNKQSAGFKSCLSCM
ncbi:hypothetical protein D027_0209B, partial [Vibrio parahaemolyticus 861]